MRILLSGLAAVMIAAFALAPPPAAAQQYLRSLSGYTCSGPIYRAVTVHVRFVFFANNTATIQTDMDGFTQTYAGWTWAQNGNQMSLQHQDGSVLSGALQGATIEGYYDNSGGGADYDGPTTLTCARS